MVRCQMGGSLRYEIGRYRHRPIEIACRARNLTLVKFLLCSGLLLALFGSAACESLPASDVCESSSYRTCDGPNGCQGQQVCDDDGQSYDTCRCTSTMDSGVPRAQLGAECGADEQCAQGAFCLTAAANDYFGGAPAKGTCVAECAEGRCDEFEQATCVDVGLRSLCFEACTLGKRETSRCHDRAQVACDHTTEGAAFCRPLCSRNADCASGHCVAATGACTSDASEEEDFGHACSRTTIDDAGSAGCSGLCVDVSGQFDVCSHRCEFGESTDCSLLDGVRGGCLIASPGGSIADVGYCAPLCDTDEGCAAFGRTCELFADPVLESAFGARGACTADGSASVNDAGT